VTTLKLVTSDFVPHKIPKYIAVPMGSMGIVQMQQDPLGKYVREDHLQEVVKNLSEALRNFDSGRVSKAHATIKNTLNYLLETPHAE
jgi:hypothetical protein